MATGASINSNVVTKELIKRVCYNKIESIVPSSIDWDNVIGQGTYGIILGTIIDDDWVVKVANKKGSCDMMNHEYTLHNMANDALDHVKTINQHLPIFCPQTRNFAFTEGCCWYYMSKIYKDTPKLMHTTISSNKTEEKWSGIFPTPLDLSEYIDSELKPQNKLNEDINDINTISYLNGVIYGLLHYGSKQTAQDIEIVLGKTSETGKYNIFFYDFDKSSLFETFDKNTIKLLGISLTSAYSAFLTPIGDSFKEGYRFSANIFGKNDICNIVISNAEELERMLLDDEEVGGGGDKPQRKSRKSRKSKKSRKGRKSRKSRKRKH